MNIFTESELNTVANRSLAILESLSNLGVYLKSGGNYNKIAVQWELGKYICKREYDYALYAMNTLSGIIPQKHEENNTKEYVETLEKRVRERTGEVGWLKRVSRTIVSPFKNFLLRRKNS